jgi:ATP-dependent RNA helicase DeaD
MQTIERFIRQVIHRERIPSVEQVEGRRADLIFDSLKERLESGKFDTYQDNIDRLLDQGHTPTDIAGALVTLLREASGREGSLIDEDREPERPARREKSRDVRAPREDSRDDRRDDRGPKPGPKFERGPIPHEEGMTRMFLSLGKTHGVMAKEIVGMLYREAGLPDGCLGRITLFPKHSLVDIPESLVGQVMDRTRNARLRGRPFRIDVDRGPM